MTMLADTTFADPTLRGPGTRLGPAGPGTFTAEAELGSPVRAWLSGATAGLSGCVLHDVAIVADEIDAGAGIADIVAGHTTTRQLPLRRAITDPTTLRLLEFTKTPTPESQLRAWAPHGWRGLRQRTVAPAIAAALLTVDETEAPRTNFDEPVYTAALDVDDPFESLTAVELKLRDWRRAIAQAGRYRLWAERSYVAMPAQRLTEATITEALRNGVGLLAVHGSPGEASVTLVLEAPTAAPLQPQRRRWASEQVFSSAREPSTRRAGTPIR